MREVKETQNDPQVTAGINMNRIISEKWELILDLVGGPVTLWPRLIRHLFWKRNLKNIERFKVACFIWVNGLDPEIFYEWAALVGGSTGTIPMVGHILGAYLPNLPGMEGGWSSTGGGMLIMVDSST